MAERGHTAGECLRRSPPADVSVLAERLTYYLDSGYLAGVGQTDRGTSGPIDDAESAARAVLASVDHWTRVSCLGRDEDEPLPWDRLVEQICMLLVRVSPAARPDGRELL